jgi:hypothetical protein
MMLDEKMSVTLSSGIFGLMVVSSVKENGVIAITV